MKNKKKKNDNWISQRHGMKLLSREGFFSSLFLFTTLNTSAKVPWIFNFSSYLSSRFLITFFFIAFAITKFTKFLLIAWHPHNSTILTNLNKLMWFGKANILQTGKIKNIINPSIDLSKFRVALFTLHFSLWNERVFVFSCK